MVRPPSPRTAISKLFDSANLPVYVLDESSRLTFVNVALATWLNVKSDELTGMTCRYTSDPSSGLGTLPNTAAMHPSGSMAQPLGSIQSLADQLCPPPSVFDGEPACVVIEFPTVEGSRSCTIEFHPIADELGAIQGVMAMGSQSPAGRKRFDESPARSAQHLHQQLLAHRASWRDDYHLDTLVGTSDAAVRLRRQIRLAASCGENVLLVGPPGSGKEHLARTIHHARLKNSEAPLVPLACAVLDAELLATSVTAFLRRCAELETARSPTLLLLDVDQLETHAQAELMGFLAIGELELRTLATSRRSLRSPSPDFEFRSDLASLLGILPIDVPPLAERRIDLPLLSQQFVEQCNASSSSPRNGLTTEAVEVLATYNWPENLDELRRVIFEAHQKAEGGWIRGQDLPKRLQESSSGVSSRRSPRDLSVNRLLAQVESSLLSHALRISKGNKSKAARLVGMSRAKFLRRLEHFLIELPANPQAQAKSKDKAKTKTKPKSSAKSRSRHQVEATDEIELVLDLETENIVDVARDNPSPPTTQQPPAAGSSSPP